MDEQLIDEINQDAADDEPLHDLGGDELINNDNAMAHNPQDYDEPAYDSGEDVMIDADDDFESDDDIINVFEESDSGDSEEQTDEGSGSSDEDPDPIPEDNDAVNIRNGGGFEPFFHINVEGAGLDEPLRARGNIERWEKVLLEIAKSLRFKHTYMSMLASLKIANMEFDNAKLPTTMKAFWKLVNRKLNHFKHSIVCTICWDDLGSKKKPNRACRCGRTGPGLPRSELGTLLYLNISCQLRGLLEKPGMITDLQYPWTRVKRNPDAIEDVYDGSEYQRLSADGGFLARGNHNYSLALWTDGVDPAPSSRVTIWPVFVQVLELSPRARQRHSILAALYVGPRKPDMTKFLTPIATDLRKLYIDGITWYPNEDPEVVSRFLTLIVSADSEARYLIMGMMRHNAFFGCTFCHARGERVGDNNQFHIYRYNAGYIDRTDADIRRDANRAMENNAPENGVRALSALSIIPGINLRTCQLVEALHCLWERNFTRLYSIITNRNGANYISPLEIRTISSRIELVKPPTKLARHPRPLEDFAKFKGTEYRNLAWYYWLPCAQDFMDRDHIEYFSLFAEATYILNKDSILPEELIAVDSIIKDFLRKSADRFPAHLQTYSLHMLQHTVRCVRELGPLWVASGFWFESLNRQIKNYITSPTDRALQVACRVLMAQMVERCLDWPLAPAVLNMLRSFLHKARWAERPEVASGRFVRHTRGVPGNLNPQEIMALAEAGYEHIDEQLPINRLQLVCIDGVTYQPQNNRPLKYDNSVVHVTPLDDNNPVDFIRIISIITWQREGEMLQGVFGLKFITVGPAFKTTYMKIVEQSRNLIYLPLTSINAPAVLVESSDKIYVSPIPNRWDVD